MHLYHPERPFWPWRGFYSVYNLCVSLGGWNANEHKIPTNLGTHWILNLSCIEDQQSVCYYKHTTARVCLVDFFFFHSWIWFLTRTHTLLYSYIAKKDLRIVAEYVLRGADFLPLFRLPYTKTYTIHIDFVTTNLLYRWYFYGPNTRANTLVSSSKKYLFAFSQASNIYIV